MLLTAMIAFTVVVGITVRALIGTVRTLLQDEVTPLVQGIRQSVQRIQGTVTFISETAVSPVIRIYGIFAGARRAAGVVSGVRRRVKGNDSDDHDD